MREASLQRYPIEFSNLKANYTYIFYQTQVNFKKDLKKKKWKHRVILIKNKASRCKSIDVDQLNKILSTN